MLPTTSTETTILLPTPEGHHLELLLPAISPTEPTPAAYAIICHPHPLHGGTMHNKVITTLAKTFTQLNIPPLRFNFRGVGQSTGHYAEGEGELQDLLTVQSWLKDSLPAQTPIWLAGFSFGAWISIRAANLTPPAGLISIAPPITRFPLSSNLHITSPWIIVQGEQDELIPTPDVLTWTQTLTPPPHLILFPNATHFFHGHLTTLRETLLKTIKSSLP